MFKLIVTVTIITVIITFFTCMNIKSVEIEKSINSIKKEINYLDDENKKILLSIEKLKDIDRIKTLAKNKLGFVNTNKKDFVIMGIKDKEELLNYLKVNWNISSVDNIE